MLPFSVRVPAPEMVMLPKAELAVPPTRSARIAPTAKLVAIVPVYIVPPVGAKTSVK